MYYAAGSRTTHAAAEASMLAAAAILHAARRQREGALFAQAGHWDAALTQIRTSQTANGISHRRNLTAAAMWPGASAALWCFYTTTSYRDAIPAAANGYDADDAAICGQVAGHYGIHLPRNGSNGQPCATRSSVLRWRCRMPRRQRLAPDPPHQT